MATITFGQSGTRPYGVLTVTETSTSTANNTSTLSISLVLKRPYSISSSSTKTASCTINGTTYTWSGKIGGSGDLTLISKTQTVTHNADGTKSISISASITLDITWSGTYIGTISGSGTMALTNIPRYATVSQSNPSKTETTITMKWTSNATVDYIWYSINNGSTWTGINVADGTSGNYTISGLTANTAYNIKTRVRRKDSQLTTDSTALSVTTYNYPYASNMPNFTIGSSLAITVYNPLGRTYSLQILGADNSVIGTYSGSGTQPTGFNDNTSVNNMYASIPNAQSGTYKVKVVYGSSTITKTGGKYSVNANVCKPLISGGSYQDTNSTVIAITGNNQNIVQNKSTVQFTATGLTGQKSATIAACKVTVNAIDYALTVSGSTATGGNAVIDSATDIEAVFTVTDSRGLTATKSITLTMLEWSLPTAIITIQRQSNFYSATDIMVDADYASIDGHNSVTIQYRYKKTTEGTYSAYASLTDGVTSTFTIDNLYEWNVQIVITDLLGGSTTYNVIVPKGMPLIYFDRLKNSVGINCFPNDDESLEVNGVNIVDNINYKSGDSFSIVGDSSTNYSNRLIVSGMLTSTAKEIWFSVPLPKSMANVTPTITALGLNVRVASGGYLLSSAYIAGGYDVLADDTLTVIAAKSTDNMLTIEIQKSTAWSGTNNTPIIIAVENIAVDFS